jgi:xanthine dehydrogenase YagR molybdenum-binding subunit
MAPYIGTSTSRVDGHAKVTGAAKYAGELNTPGLVYGSLVTSTIPKGRIAHIDASEALRVGGVIEVLTHRNRPPMASTDAAYKDDVAPDSGAPFRPLYDDRIKFSGQPVALVVAQDWETARFAASLVRVEYEAEAHITDLLLRRDQAFEVARRSRGATPPRLSPRPRCATRATITFRSSITIRWNCSPRP